MAPASAFAPKMHAHWFQFWAKRSGSGSTSLRSGKSCGSQFKEGSMGVELRAMLNITHWVVKPYYRSKFHSVKIWLVNLPLNSMHTFLALMELRLFGLQWKERRLMPTPSV